jgi:energy-coupling factor transporter transmembrane protein EcfT
LTIQKLLDGYALIAAMIADIGILLVCFIVVSPGPVEAVGMSILSLVVVLFAVRAWIKGGFLGKSVWAMFALVAFFFDLSFVLVSTDMQTQTAQSKTVDSELIRLEAVSKRALDSLDKAQLRYDDALNRGNSKSTLDAIKSTLDAAQGNFDNAEKLYQSRLVKSESGLTQSEHRQLSADSLSTAIYDAATSGKPGRITFLILFGLLFLGLQLTMVTAANSTKATPAKTIPEPVTDSTKRMQNFVSKCWYNVNRKNGNGNILQFGSLNYYTKGQFTKDEYKANIAKLKSAKIIDDEGKILINNEAHAVDVLL